MPNTLTNLIGPMHRALDIVAREMVGLIPAVDNDLSLREAAVGEVIRWPVTPALATANISAAATGPDPSAMTIGNSTLTISKSKSATFFWEAEEQVGLRNAGTFDGILTDNFAQAMRALVNEVESDLAGEYAKFSRAYGAAGTTPFGSSITDLAEILKILKDNGTPNSDLQVVLNTAAGAKLRSLSGLYKVNESGDQNLLRRGVLSDLYGFAIRESAGIKSHTKGTGTGYVTNLVSPLPVGSTVITVDTGANTILAGDVVTFTGDTNKYLVTSALSGGSFTIAAPGLRQTLADGVNVTVGDSYTGNMAFHRKAIKLVTRVPAMPEGGDSADDVMVVQDPVSGLAFQVAMYRQRRRVAYEVGLAWGWTTLKTEFGSILLG